MTGLRLIGTGFRASKKTVYIAIASLMLAFLIAGAVFWNMKTWGDYEKNYNRSFKSAQTDIDEAILYVSSESKDNSVEKLLKIAKIESELTHSIDSYCNISSIIRWQSFVKTYANKMSDCESKKNDFGQFLGKFNGLTVYLKAEQGLATIIKQANDKTSQNNQPDKWKDIELFWRQATVDTNKLPDTSQFKPVKLLAANKFDQLAESWKQLSSANDAKNSQQFYDAHASIIKSVASLQEIGETSQSAVKQLAEDLNKSYDGI